MPTTALGNDLVLRAARGERTSRTPVWLMRQAGRFDSAYRALRERCGLPLEEMFRNPEISAEVTLLPKRFGVDALIIFQDILRLPEPMGRPFVFRPGPVLDRPVRSPQDVRALRDFDPAEDLADVAAALRAVKNELDGALPLLGFAGAPFTVAAFMIEGRSPGGRLDATRALMRDEPAILHDLLERLSRMTAAYLRMQIDAGADAVQLFESLGDLLTDEEYRTFAHPYQAQALADLPGSAPRILFVKERPCVELMAATGADAISVGSCVDLADARRRLGPGVGLQGNVDNQLLARGSREAIEAAVRRCAREGGQRGHILNLSHGLLADTPEDNVRRLIDACHAFRLDDADGPGSPREGTPS